jgi:hypothetical protein
MQGVGRLYRNTSLYSSAGQLRYVERRQIAPDGSVNYALSAVESDEFLTTVLDVASNGATIDELITCLLPFEVDRTEALDFLQELVDSELLIAELDGPLTGDNVLEDTVRTMQRLAPNDPLTNGLSILASALRDFCSIAPGNGTDVAVSLEQQIAALTTRPDGQDNIPKSGLDIQLRPVALSDTISRRSMEMLLDGVDILARIAAVSATGGIRQQAPEVYRFAQKLAERFGEHEWVPLAYALDAENGVGFGGAWSRLLRSDGAEATYPAQDAWRSYLHRAVNEANARGDHVLELDLSALPDVKLNADYPITDSVSVLATMGAVSDDYPHGSVFIKRCAGPSSAAYIGRFCNGHDQLTHLVREQLKHEDKRYPDVTFVEIVHLPRGRLGNVIARPQLREHEIHYLGLGAASDARRITVDDIAVAVVGGKIILWSHSLKSRIIPRLSCAHSAWQADQLPVYRFLHMLQYQDSHEHLTWDWKDCSRVAHLPRVVVGPAILATERWRLTTSDLREFQKTPSGERRAWLRQLRARLQLPQHVLLADDDNELFIDFESDIGVDYLADELRGREVAVLTEVFPPVSDAIVRGEDGTYAHEIMVPLVNRAGRRRLDRVRAPNAMSLPIVFPPGSEWLYLKLYCGIATADKILCEIVGPLLDELRASGHVDHWFFVRFGDPENHIRIRMHGTPGVLSSVVLPACQAAIEPLLRNGGIAKSQVDTYAPESVRYGVADQHRS